ncbi:gluconate transport inducer 1/Pac2 [Immersiella caudata]|uniref:Gluconate transport inducer 1/Pac2 n=1 Tax=Immersiella caudata TaxID=314043 RepID=A0AA39WXJ5_9PEZI|nr:gluconate transport inducer 1/Pac2 [Immersiella caudata]
MSSSQAQPPPQQQQVPLTPTYRGMILTTWDALVLYEAALSGVLNHVPRRPHDKERTELIRSGNIFIYEEDTSGIKRWTDGLTWSPSRILTNFLIYREMDQPFTPGEKKKALKKKDQNRINKRTSSSPSPPTPRLGSRSSSIPGVDPEQLRAFVGSLTDSYSFKQGGLVTQLKMP